MSAIDGGFELSQPTFLKAVISIALNENYVPCIIPKQK